MNFTEADLVDRLEISLTEEQEKKLNSWLDEKKEAIDIARTAFNQRNQKFLYNWDDFVTFNRKGPWENSSNLHMPLTAIMVKTYHARLYNIFSNETTVQLNGREGMDDDQAKMIRSLRSWYLWDYLNGYKGIRGFQREVFYDSVTVGFGIGMKDWHTKMRKIIDVELKEVSREMKDLAPQIAESQQNAQLLETEEETEKKSVNIKPYKEVQKIVEHFAGSRVRAIPYECAYFPNNIPESSDLDHPPCVIIEVEMSVSDIMLKGKRGEWPMQKCWDVVNEGTANYIGSRANQIKQTKERLSGWNDMAMIYDRSPRRIQFCFATYDIDGDMIDEEIVAIRSDKGTILKTIFLDKISRSGMRPLYKFDCFSKSRQAYSRGVPEYMYPLNEEMDMGHNMRLDYLALQTCPFGTYRASSSLKNQPIRIAPGKFIPTEETSDMKVLNFQTNAMVLGQEEDRLWHYAERLAGVSSLSSGIVPQQVGPTRSTSGVVALLSQMDKEFRPVVDGIALQWKKLEKMLLDDLEFRVSPQLKMRVLGASVEEFIDPNQDVNAQMDIINTALRINGLFDLRIDVADAIRSDEVFRADATAVLQMITAPTIASQLGVIGPKGVMKAWNDWLKSYGKEPDDFLDKPAFIGKPLTLYQEIQLCYQNELPPMAMQDEHEVKAQQLQAWIQEPEYLLAKSQGIVTNSADMALMKAANKHMVIAQMMQPKGLPNPSGQNNMSVSQDLAGQGQNQQPKNKESNGKQADAGSGKRGDVQSPNAEPGVGGGGGSNAQPA